MKKSLLVVNPSSGGEKAKDFEIMMKEKLETYFEEVNIKHTEKQYDATKFVKQACEDKYHSVFVMGGDGTVNEGINGIAEQEYRPKFGFIPLGTVNDLARALNIPLDPEEAIENINFDTLTPLDIGKVNDKYFMNIVGVGTIPEAINDTPVEEKTKYGVFAYIKKGLQKVMDNKPYTFDVVIDGEKKEITSSLVLVCSTSSVGGLENVLKDAKVNDGYLHLVYTKDETAMDLIKAIPDIVGGIDSASENIGYIDFKRASISLKENEELSINYDGEEGGNLPIDVEVLPSHIEVYYGGIE